MCKSANACCKFPLQVFYMPEPGAPIGTTAPSQYTRMFNQVQAITARYMGCGRCGKSPCVCIGYGATCGTCSRYPCVCIGYGAPCGRCNRSPCSCRGYVSPCGKCQTRKSACKSCRKTTPCGGCRQPNCGGCRLPPAPTPYYRDEYKAHETPCGCEAPRFTPCSLKDKKSNKHRKH